MNSEEIVQHLLEFVANTGKIPELDEPGLEKLIQEAIRTFGSLKNALRVAGLQTDSAWKRKKKKDAIAYCTRCEKLFYYRDAWEKHKKERHEINENQSQ